MRLRSVLSLILIIALSVTILSASASAAVLQTGARPFNDVVRHSWYYNYVYSAYDQEVFSGMDAHTFGTHTAMTRGMLVTVLYGLAGKPETAEEAPFDDVKPDRYYAPAVSWAYDKGVVQGLSDTVFAPDMNVSGSRRLSSCSSMPTCPGRRSPGRRISRNLPMPTRYPPGQRKHCAGPWKTRSSREKAKGS